MVRFRCVVGRRTRWCLALVFLLVAAGCSPDNSVAPLDTSSAELASPQAPESDVGTTSGQGRVTALTVAPSRVWGNGRALRAAPLADGRTAVVTTIGIDLVDGSEVTTLDRFPATTLLASVAASSDGSMLAVATTVPRQITWYDLADGAVAGRQELAANVLVKNIVFGADAETLWVQTDDAITVVGVGDLALGEVEPFGTQVSAPAISNADGLARAALRGSHQVLTLGTDRDPRLDTVAGLGDESVVATRMSPSGEILAVMAEDEFEFAETPKRIVVLDAASMVPRTELVIASTANSQVWGVSETHVAVANGVDVELHSLDTGEITRWKGLEGPGADPALLFMVADAVVGVLENGTILRWTANAEVAETLATPTNRPIESASVALDARSVVAIDRSGVVTSVRFATGSEGAAVETMRMHDFAVGEVNNVGIDEESARIVGSTTTGDVVVLDPELSVQSRFSVSLRGAGAVEFVPGSTDIVTGLNERTGAISFDDTVASWEPATGQASFRIGGESEEVVGCAFFYSRVVFFDGGKSMAMTSHDFTVGLADTNSGEEFFRFEPELGALLDIAVTPDGSKLIVSSDVGSYTVWDMEDQTKVGTFPAVEGSYQVLAVLPDNRTMATTSLSGVFGLVDIESGERLSEFEVIGRGVRRPGPIAVSRDGSLLATPIGGDGVGIWSTETGQRLATLVGHAASVTDVDIAPDMTYLATASSDGTIRTWTLDISTG